MTDDEKRAAWARAVAAGLPDPLPWGTVSETGRHLKDVEGASWRARVWCFHTKKARRLLAVVLSDGTLITDDNVEQALRSATGRISVHCSSCPRGKGTWRLNPGRLRARIKGGLDPAKIGIEHVGERRLRSGDDETYPHDASVKVQDGDHGSSTALLQAD